VSGTNFDSAKVTTVDYHSSEKPDETLESLLVANAAESAQRLTAILRGEERGTGREMLELNAAFAGWTQGRASSLEEGAAQSAEAIASGRAYDCLLRWQKFSRD
jgi:anthranilate phosphoribosyltransferase